MPKTGLPDRTEYYRKTDVFQVFIWSCDACGQTSIPRIHSTYGDADKALQAHWDTNHA